MHDAHHEQDGEESQTVGLLPSPSDVPIHFETTQQVRYLGGQRFTIVWRRFRRDPVGQHLECSAGAFRVRRSEVRPGAPEKERYDAEDEAGKPCGGFYRRQQAAVAGGGRGMNSIRGAVRTPIAFKVFRRQGSMPSRLRRQPMR